MPGLPVYEAVTHNRQVRNYAYVSGKPIGYTDPFSLYYLSDEEINGIFGAAGGAASGALALSEFGPVGMAIGGAIGGT